MEYTLREFRVGDPHDAELLAAMWNASDDGWPGGWTGGVPETAERVLEQTKKIDRIAIFVVEVDGEIVGYGDMEQVRGRDGVAYLDLLNVRPDLHDRGLGKALVLKVVERTIERGYNQLTIGTWAGNRKSVPLYKKTGFFWVPETGVWMQNYIPTIFTMPIAKPFFANRDWYACFKRELEAVPDDIKWNGIKVYPYRFEEGGDLFAMWIDKQAEAPTAVETNDLCAACIVGKEDVVCGPEQTVRWEIVNKKGAEEPLQVVLMAEGEEGIGLSVMENFQVEDKTVIKKSFTVSPDIKPKDEGMPTHQIKSTLLLNGVPVTLGTAVKPVQPVDIQFGAHMVVAGKPEEKVVVRLKSNLDFPVQGELLIDPHSALHFDKLRAPFRLEPKSWTSCTFYLQVEGNGAFATKMRAVCPSDLNPDSISGDSPLTTKSKPVTFLTQPIDSTYAWHSEEEKAITVETPTMWVRVNLRGGEVAAHDRLSGRQFFSHQVPGLGPPFGGWNHVPPTYAYRLEKKDGKVLITLIIPSDRVPGMTIEKTITVGTGSFIRIDHRILNATDAAQKFKLRCGAWNDLIDGGKSKLTLPFKDGIIHELYQGWGGFPMGDRDLPKEPENYAESWCAVENSGLVTGIVFGECEEREDNMTLQFDLPEIPPRTHYDLEPFYLVAARGNWGIVRQLWRWLKQPSTVRETRNPIVHPALDARFKPEPLFITQPEVDAKLVIDSRRGKLLNGEWRIEDCGLQIQPIEGNLADIKRGNPLEQKVKITTADLTPRVEKARVLVTEEVTTHQLNASAIILGDDSQSVIISPKSDEGKPPAISVDNGCFSFTVAPTFLGAITALGRAGVNHVNSSYPKAGPHTWGNPWFGGIHPFVHGPDNQWFVKEKFSGEPVKHTGKTGIVWNGVKIECDLQHKNERWLRIETEYLTFGGSNILAMVYRLVNKTDAPQGTGSGLCIWPRVGGTYDNVMHYMHDCPCYEQAESTDRHVRLSRHRRHSQFGFGTKTGRWAAFENPKTGDVMAVIAPHPNTEMEIEDDGDEGGVLVAAIRTGLEPKETKEILVWLVIANSVKEAQTYRALTEIYELP